MECGVFVCFTAATKTALSFSGMVWRMRTDLQNLHTTRQRTQPQPQDHRRGDDGSQETHQHKQLSCRRQGSPTAIDYRSGERARITMKPQTKCARSKGTTSPQISVTFRRFSYQPIIWNRGPRTRAHWYMCANAANSQNYHMEHAFNVYTEFTCLFLRLHLCGKILLMQCAPSPSKRSLDICYCTMFTHSNACMSSACIY